MPAAPSKHFLVASDFDQTLSFNDSGRLLSEMLGITGFEEKVADAVESLAAIPGITREQADVLVHHGLTRLEDLLQADVSDLTGMPQVGDQAAVILDAARAEAARRTLKVGEAPVSG